MHDRPIITAQQYFLEQQRQHYPDASGEFSWLLSGITLATKMIQAQVRRAGLVHTARANLRPGMADMPGAHPISRPLVRLYPKALP